MAKLTAKEVTVGMEFEVISNPNREDFDSFGNKFDDMSTLFGFGPKHEPAIGTILQITKVPHSKISETNIVSWKEKGSNKEWDSFWNTFKNGTEYVSGDYTFNNQ